MSKILVSNIKTPFKTGDIILIERPKNKNLMIQSILRIKKAKHSHVAIVLSNMNLIHAMPKRGVCIESISSYIAKNKDFCVFRNNKFASSCDRSHEIIEHYYGQKYSLLSMMLNHHHHSSSFCSELVAKIYNKKVGIKITEKTTQKTLPIDIYDYISQSKDWHSVTNQYKRFLRRNKNRNFDFLENIERKMIEFDQHMVYAKESLYLKINSVDKTELLPSGREYWWSRNSQNSFGIKHRIKFTVRYWGMMIASAFKSSSKIDK